MLRYTKEWLIDKNENIRIEKKAVNSETKANEIEHTHEFVEIVYVNSGHATQHIGETTFVVRRGDLFFVENDQIHSFELDGEFTYTDILIDPVIVSEELVDKMSVSEILSIATFNEVNTGSEITVQHVHFGGEGLTVIENLLHNMIYEFNNKEKGYVSVLSEYTKILFSLLNRKMGEKVSREENANETVLEIMEYVNSRCYEKISLDEIAQKCFYNPTYLSHIFKKYCGQTLSAYIKEKRIQYAVELLETTNYTVERISEKVGYSDKTLFYRMFKEVTGKRPSDYRNSNDSES